MTTKVEKSVQVAVPLRTAYDQWTQFEDFPHFMGGVKEVRQLDDRRMHWVAEIGGVRREWEAEVLEQVPDQRVSWAATSGATNAGSVRFVPVDAGSTMVYLTLEYEPEGLVEQVGDKLGIVGRQAESDLERFKGLVEDQGYASGGWRGTVGAPGAVGTPGVEAAAPSRGDDGKAGVSGKTVAAGAAVAAGLAAAGVAAARSGGSEHEGRPVETDVDTTAVPASTSTVPPASTTAVPPTSTTDADAVEVLDVGPDGGTTSRPVPPA